MIHFDVKTIGQYTIGRVVITNEDVLDRDHPVINIKKI